MFRISDFEPEHDVGVEFQLVNYLARNGYEPEVGSGFWELVVRKVGTGKEVWIHKARKTDLKRDVTALTTRSDATRILVFDFDLGDIPMLNPWFLAATSEGIGMYHVGTGWINAPHQGGPNRYKELVPLLNPRYTLVDGELMKACGKCGEIKPLTEFYMRPRSQNNPKDPYRNFCKDCHWDRT